MLERMMKQAANEMVSRVVAMAREMSKEVGDERKQGVMDRMEEAVWDAMRRLAARVQEALIQGVIEESERGKKTAETCKGCGAAMAYKGVLGRGLTTRNGEVRFQRRTYYCRKCKRWEAPVEARLGIPAGRSTSRVEEMMTLLGSSRSFATAQDLLKRLTGLSLSSTRIRETTEEHGTQVQEAYTQGEIQREWDYEQGDGRLYGLVDGAMVNTVKGGWKEMRYLLYQDLEGRQKHARARFGDSEECGRLMREEAIRIEASKAREIVFTADTAGWIRKEVSRNLPMATQVADFYHMSSHVSLCGELLYPKDEGQRKAWVEELLHVMRHEGATGGLRWLKRRRPAARSAREAVVHLTQYIEKNKERMDYPRYQAAGIPIGSGPVESLCKSVNTQRLKLPGARWNPANAEAVAELRCLYISGNWDTYWATQRARKAA